MVEGKNIRLLHKNLFQQKKTNECYFENIKQN